MNILHVYKTYSTLSRGGIEEVLYQLSNATTKLGHKNRIVCLSSIHSEKQIIETPQATIYYYPQNFEIASCGMSWQLWWDFKKLVDWSDIVHYQFPWPFGDLLALTRASSKPFVVSYQSDIVRQAKLNYLYKPLMTRFLNKASAIVATSPAYADTSPVLNNYKSKLHVIPNGISDLESKYSYKSEEDQYREFFGDDFFLFIGVFRYYKGLKYLLKAAQQTKTPIVLVGSGAEAETLKDYVHQHNLEHVHFLGSVSDKQKHALLSLCKALILPSSYRSEAYGMVLLEAAMHGKAMISTELGSGTSYINKNDLTGLVVKAKDSDALAYAMNEFEQNPNRVEVMSKKARERFLEMFTADIMGQKYHELYQSLSLK
jgi:rhamnosyl/mannosyltransferase